MQMKKLHDLARPVEEVEQAKANRDCWIARRHARILRKLRWIERMRRIRAALAEGEARQRALGDDSKPLENS